MAVIEPAGKKAVHGSKSHIGLSEKEARKRLDEYGPNVLTDRTKVSAFRIFIEQFSDFMVLILLASTALSLFMGEMTEAITIIAIVILNSILGFIQEYRTERTLQALKRLSAPTAKVFRNNKLVSIPAEEIVPGDVVMLEAGDKVPADGVLVESKSLHIDESLLTGESLPVEKSAENYLSSNMESAKGRNSVFMGTIVTSGWGKTVVLATAMRTEMGKIADMIQNIDDNETPLQRKLNHLGKLIALGCILICLIITVTGVLRGEDLYTMLLSGISLAVAAVPEGLPAIVTIALALGVQRMLKRNALIRKLPAVETLGCADIICSDKTGTLTENKMTVRRIYAGENMIEVEGIGFNPEGSFHANGREINPQNLTAVKLALEIGALCNNSKLVRRGKSSFNSGGRKKSVLFKSDIWEIQGDPTEGALLTVAAKGGLTEDVLAKGYFRIDEIPFDSDRKLMTVVCDNSRGDTFVFTKGAPDIIIKKCTRIYTKGGISNLVPSVKSGIMNINDKMAGDALRVLGFAFKKLENRNFSLDQIENGLVFVGLMGMIDPPREEAVEAVQKCKLAGIKPVMITGDHKLTACAIGKELNIYTKGDRVVTGAELEEMNDRKLEKIAGDISVYARVSPKHKLRIVSVLKKLGHIVAMTGDGVNDAPAVKEADIGVAMGISGTDVTKEASSMILLDDNFATIVAAIEEGRVIYSNIRKFIRYLLACNIGEVLTMFLAMIIGLPLPLFPIQILWVNLVTDGLPAIALGLEPPEKDIMMRAPRGSKDNIFSHGLLSIIVSRGILMSLSTLAVFTSIIYFTGDISIARTGAFVTLIVTQLIHVFECKSERINFLAIPLFNNIFLILSVACSMVMMLSVVYIPVLQGVFRTVSLSLNEWMLILGFSFIVPVSSGLFRKGYKNVGRKYS